MIPCPHSLKNQIKLLGYKRGLFDADRTAEMLAVVDEHVPSEGGFALCAADSEPWPCAAVGAVLKKVGPLWRNEIRESRRRLRDKAAT